MINKIIVMFENIKPMKLDSSERGIFFTSDTHWGHLNILKLCSRPCPTVEEMDEALINNWNSVVGKNDIVFHLGDFAFAPNWRWKEIISRLNGEIHLIIGNHDEVRWPGDSIMSLFAGVYNQLKLKIDNQHHVYLNHYPFLCYGGTYRAPENCVIQLHGHTHEYPGGTGKDMDRLKHRFPYQYDVGVDNNNYTPVSWDKIKSIIQSQIKAQ